ncbi:MAG: right-handed parallel beta-helix repeat-containing protein, partial [Planctomycetota bacterium]
MKTAFLLIAVLCVPALAFSDTIYVPDDYPTIQQAIDAAVNGDTIIVRPGTYVENIDFKGKGTTVQSSHGPEVTVINGENPANPDLGSVISFHNGEGLDAVLDGFTLTQGTGTWYEPYSGYFYF